MALNVSSISIGSIELLRLLKSSSIGKLLSCLASVSTGIGICLTTARVKNNNESTDKLLADSGSPEAPWKRKNDFRSVHGAAVSDDQAQQDAGSQNTGGD